MGLAKEGENMSEEVRRVSVAFEGRQVEINLIGPHTIGKTIKRAVTDMGFTLPERWSFRLVDKDEGELLVHPKGLTERDLVFDGDKIAVFCY